MKGKILADSSGKIYSSAPSEADDDLWLDEGKRMVTESLNSVHNTANALIASLGMLQSLYLGILSFGKPLPASLSLLQKALLVTPMILWLLALYFCIITLSFHKTSVFLNSPTDIREKITAMALQKQRRVRKAFWLLVLGMLAVFIIFFWRLNL